MPSVKRYTLITACVGLISVVASYSVGGFPPVRGHAVALGALAALTIWIPLRIERTEGTQGFTSEEAVFVALLVTVPWGLVPITMFVSAAVAHAVRRPGMEKVLFNSGQVGLWASGGVAVFAGVGQGASILSPRTVVAVLLAVATANVISLAALSGLMHRLGGAAPARIWSEAWRLNTVTALGNISVGLLIGVVVDVDLRAAVLGSTLLLGLYLGYRGYAGQIDERRRTEDLHEFTRSLLDFAHGGEHIPQLLERVKTSVGASQVLLALPEIDALDESEEVIGLESLPGAIRRRGLDAVRGTHVAEQKGLVEALGQLGYRDALISTVARSRGEPGVLLALGRSGLEPWHQTHVTLLATIATELGVALDSMQLFAEVERERARWQAESTKLADILGAATDGIALIRGDGTIETWNPGMSGITGVEDRQAVGQPWFVVMRLRDDSGEELMPDTQHPVVQALQGQQRLDQSVLIQAMRRDGTWRWLSCTVAPVAAHGETPEGSVLVARDVTSEREVDELKSDFIATVSHELRTPLTPLKGFIGTLRRTAEPARSQGLDRALDAMGNQVNRLEALISDLLAVAELETGHFDVNPEHVDLVDHVWVAAEVEAGPASDRLTLDVRNKVSAMADPLALTRIVRALVSNALKHTDGRIVIRIDESDGRAELSIIDEGPGIPPWEHTRIFERFERLGDHLRRTQGPGLGLTIARALARRLNGDLTIESDVGTGSTFTVTLPAAQRPRLRLAASE